MERNPQINPKPGDIFSGPKIRMRVEWVKTGIGLLPIELACAFSFKTAGVSTPFAGSRTFSLREFQAFVGGKNVEVIPIEDNPLAEEDQWEE